MGLFKIKTKSSKKDSKAEKPTENSQQDQKPAATYKHVPTHAALDAMGQAGRSTDASKIAMASQDRIANSAFDSTLGNAAYRLSMTRDMVHGMPSPSLPSPGAWPRSGPSSPRSLKARSINGDYVVADANAPPMPSPYAYKASSMSRRGTSASRAENDYFSLTGAASAYNSATNSKAVSPMPHPEYAVEHRSSDSGYGSAGPSSAIHSRAPSEKNAPTVEPRYMSDLNEGLMSDFNFTQELLNLPEFAEPISDKSRSNSSTYLQQQRLESHSENQKVRFPKPSPSIKKTRFEDDAEPSLPTQIVAAPVAAQSEPPVVQQPSFDKPVVRQAVFDYAMPAQTLTPPPDEEESSKTQHSYQISNISRTSSVNSTRAPIARSNLPPLSVLEGFKVNKKGQILDEEGEAIGQLVEGDIMDCVRQKVNAYGEVLDEFGGVVGIVRTLARGIEASHTSEQSAARRSSVISLISQSGRDEDVVQRGRSLSVSRQHEQAVAPLDLPSEAQVELDASRESEALPVIDQSDIFSPDFIPARSTRRPSPTSSSADERELTMASVRASVPRAITPVQAAYQKLVANDVHPAQASASTTAPTQQQTEQPRRPVRNTSERSLSELSKSYARPAMSSVPENNVPENEGMPTNPELFSYKGVIPLKDGLPQQTPHMHARAYQALNAPYPGKQFGTSRPQRHLSSQSMTSIPTIRPGLSPRHSLSNYPTRRSPLASHGTSSCVTALYCSDVLIKIPPAEATPNDSDADAATDNSGSDDGKYQQPLTMHSRAASVRTMASTAGSATRPRTYFTHSGKITVQPGEASSGTTTPISNKAASAPAPAASKSAPPSIKEDKKKNRFSLAFSKKGAAVAAH